jgi:acetylornithine deacetylase
MPGPNLSPAELLGRLVAFDTTSHKSNLGIVAFIEDYLARHGVGATRVTTPDGEKASLYATIGPPDVPGAGLSAHTDVVPVDGQTWTSDPFTLTQRGDRLHGRGTSDMKGFLACMLAMVPDLRRRRLKKPIHLLVSYDEEIGCIGVRPMIAELGRTLTRPRLVIVGEPTRMAVVDAHKGPVRWRVTVEGRAAHSSMAHLGCNAIHHAGRLHGELARIEADLMRGERNARFNPPYSSLQVTEIEGGTAANIVPIACSFGF